MAQPTDRLEQRILLMLLKEGPLPLGMFGNVMTKRAIIDLKRQGLVRTRWRSNPHVVLTGAGRRQAQAIYDRREQRRQRTRLTQR